VRLWFPAVTVPAGFGQQRGPAQLPVLTMVSGYSRWLSAVLVPSRHAADLFAGWWRLISRLGAVPRALVWDGEGAIGRWRAGKPELTAECQAFRGTLGTRVVVCRPADPEAKGLVERANGYLETSFLRGGGSPPRVPAWLRPSGRAPTAVRSCRMLLPACARTAAGPPGCWRGRRRLRRH
jgi:hypothetical protein